MSWTTEHQTTAAAESVFALWADVLGWPAWDASLIATTADDPFEAGTTGTLHPEGIPQPLPFTITAVEDGRGFIDETWLGELALRFRHRVEPTSSGSRITVAVEASGPGADEVGPAVAADLPESVAALAAAAERRTLTV
jgi:hypothetical protein